MKVLFTVLFIFCFTVSCGAQEDSCSKEMKKLRERIEKLEQELVDNRILDWGYDGIQIHKGSCTHGIDPTCECYKINIEDLRNTQQDILNYFRLEYKPKECTGRRLEKKPGGGSGVIRYID